MHVYTLVYYFIHTLTPRRQPGQLPWGQSALGCKKKISCFEIFGGQKEIQVISENYNRNDSRFLSSGRALASPSHRGQTLPYSSGFHETIEERIWTAPEHSSNYHFNK